MTSDAASKRFDCVKWTRATRDRIHNETAGMSHAERRRWREARIRKNAPLAELFDRRTPPGTALRPATGPRCGRSRSRLPWRPGEGQGERPKVFDCVGWTGEIRDRAYGRTKPMSHKERRSQLDEGLRNDSFVSRLPRARIVRPRRGREPRDGTELVPTGGLNRS